MPTFRVLRSSPKTEKTGQVSYEDGQPIRWHRVTHWPVIGTIEARSEEDALSLARAKFGGRPVIEPAQDIHYV